MEAGDQSLRLRALEDLPTIGEGEILASSPFRGKGQGKQANLPRQRKPEENVATVKNIAWWTPPRVSQRMRSSRGCMSYRSPTTPDHPDYLHIIKDVSK